MKQLSLEIEREREGGNKDFNKEFLHLPKIPTILGLALVQGPRDREKKKRDIGNNINILIFPCFYFLP